MPASPGRRPRRCRRALKWTGLVACVAIVAAWFASRWVVLSLSLGMKGDMAVLVVRLGQLVAECGPKKPSWTGPPPGLHAKAAAVDPRDREWHWDLDWALPIPVGRANSGLWLVYIPLYIPFIALALPVARLFYADRAEARPRPGACVRCGYDLAGSTTGICPECGHAEHLKTQSSKAQI